MIELKPLKQRVLEEMGYRAEDMLDKCCERSREIVWIREDGRTFVLGKVLLDGQGTLLSYHFSAFGNRPPTIISRNTNTHYGASEGHVCCLT